VCARAIIAATGQRPEGEQMRSAGRYSKLVPVALVAAGVLSLSASGTSLGSAPPPLARTASNCSLRGHEQSLGPTYVTALSVSGGASCAQGLKLVHSYYRCRIAHGGVTGHCSGVEGFRCSEDRFAKIVVQFDARVTCTRGREVVKHQYTQFT
jgi:hypothetical protein